MLSWSLWTLVFVAMLWMATELRTAWRCRACGHIVRGRALGPVAFCSRCGAPRPRGDGRAPVPIVVEGSSGTSRDVVDQVSAILDAERMGERLPAGTRATAKVAGALAAGTSIAFAHSLWNPETIPTLAGLPPFPRRPALELLPAGIVRVEIDAVERLTGGMSSQFGFEGIYASVLVSLPERTIWDVRATDAT